MARPIQHLLRLTGTLVVEDPLHIGGLDATAVTDMPVARDGLGRPYLPGTSLAGALFAALGEAESADWRGGVDPKEGPQKASRLLIDDAPLRGEAVTELWDGVGIDRLTGAAAARVKYDREVIPAGARFGLAMRFEVEDDGELAAARRLMQRARLRLEAGLPLGAGVSRGLGRVRLDEARAEEVDWRDARAVLGYLASGRGTEAAALWQQAATAEDGPRWLAIEIHWRPRLPVMVKAGQDGLATDLLPFVSRLSDGSIALTLPGAGIKGALRSQAERIVRTVLNKDVAEDAPLHEAVDVPIVREIFGLARQRTRQRGDDTGPGRGRLAVRTVYAQSGRTAEEWRRLADDTPPPGLTRAMHVAIDRWTGGAAEAFLYSATEPDPNASRWRPLVLEYRPRQGDNAALHLALLWLALEDLRAGRIALGFGKNRGYGEIVVEFLRCSGPIVHELGLPKAIEADQSLLPAAPQALREAWRAWIEKEARQ